MSKSSKRVTPDTDYVWGPSTADNSSGILQHPLQSDSVPSRKIVEAGGHSMKGILAAARGRATEQSSYVGGDKGGGSSWSGLQHGMLSSMPHGEGEGFEGGVRGGGVSVQETMPFQPRIPKKGFDEHRGKSGGASVHGTPEAEQMPVSPARGEGEGEEMSEGFGCPHGCGATMKSRHGLARHVHSRHGGFGGVGKAMHGCDYNKKEYKGETENREDMNAITSEFKSAVSKITSGPISSYESGDGGGSHSRMSSL